MKNCPPNDVFLIEKGIYRTTMFTNRCFRRPFFAYRTFSYGRPSDPSSTYFLRAGRHAPRIGLVRGALLVVDSSLTPKHGSIIVSGLDDELTVMRYLPHPVPSLQDLHNPAKVTALENDSATEYGGGKQGVWGVVTYWITPADMDNRDDVF